MFSFCHCCRHQILLQSREDNAIWISSLKRESSKTIWRRLLFLCEQQIVSSASEGSCIWKCDLLIRDVPHKCNTALHNWKRPMLWFLTLYVLNVHLEFISDSWIWFISLTRKHTGLFFLPVPPSMCQCFLRLKRESANHTNAVPIISPANLCNIVMFQKSILYPMVGGWSDDQREVNKHTLQ